MATDLSRIRLREQLQLIYDLGNDTYPQALKITKLVAKPISEPVDFPPKGDEPIKTLLSSWETGLALKNAAALCGDQLPGDRDRLSELSTDLSVLQDELTWLYHPNQDSMPELERRKMQIELWATLAGRLLAAINATAAVFNSAALQPATEKPDWNSDTGELRFREKTVRKVKRKADNVRPVLDSFQELGWPPRIDDPLPEGKNQARVTETVRTLNNGLSGIRFSADGTGAGFSWAAIE